MDERKAVIKAEHIKKYFPVKGVVGKKKAVVKAVDDVSLTVYEGETVGLVGETGCGKSTFGRTILKLTEPTDGKIYLDGEDITGYSERKLRKYRQKMQIVFQDPYSSLDPRETIGKSLEEVLQIQGRKQGCRENVLETLELVGLSSEVYDRYPHEFSGGQRQRVGIARALILNPVFLVCDEPVSALDVSVQAQIVNLLKKIQRERKLASIFISHDINVVRYISDRIVVMYLGHIVEEAPKDELIHHPKHPYTKSLLASVPNMNPRERKRHVALEGEIPSPMDPPSGCVFHTRCPYATDKCRTEVPEYKESGDGHWVRCHEV